MSLYERELYIEDLEKISNLSLEWEKFQNTTFLISGATGMIGSFLIDTIMLKNKSMNLNCRILALGRDQSRAKTRFSNYWKDKNFKFVKCDINFPIKNIKDEKIDYIFHAASNTHPKAYSLDPIGTITTNIIGSHNLLELAVEHEVKRFVFASSVEIYGENRGDCEKFTEDYCGYIDCNTLRAGYPEGKRAGEALCQAYISQKKLDIVIPRLPRVYGPTMLLSDSKVISQFIKKGVAGEDIILKSEGTQLYSYIHVADAVSAILICFLKAKAGEAYNIADEGSDIVLRDLAQNIATYVGSRIVFEIPDEIEKKGYSKATKALLNSEKIKKLGWRPFYSIEEGVKRTIEILKYS